MFTFRLEHNKQNKINKEKAFNRLDSINEYKGYNVLYDEFECKNHVFVK